MIEHHSLCRAAFNPPWHIQHPTVKHHCLQIFKGLFSFLHYLHNWIGDILSSVCKTRMKSHAFIFYGTRCHHDVSSPLYFISYARDLHISWWTEFFLPSGKIKTQMMRCKQGRDFIYRIRHWLENLSSDFRVIEKVIKSLKRHRPITDPNIFPVGSVSGLASLLLLLRMGKKRKTWKWKI